jgi:hypothetical protein
MAISFTTDDLLSRIRLHCQLKTDNQKVTSAEILTLCDEEIQTSLFPALMTVRDDYATTFAFQAFTAGVYNYRIPFEANSDTVTNVELLTLSGQTATAQRQLRRVTIGELSKWVAVVGDIPQVYAIVGGAIEVRPNPTSVTQSTYIAVIQYEMRPSRLIEVSSCRNITNATNPSGTTLQLTLGSTIVGTGLVANSLIDIVPTTPPLTPYFTNGSVISIAADPIITVTPSAVPAAVVATYATNIQTNGGYLVPRGSSCVFPMPEAWWPVLVYAGSSAVCAAIGDDTSAGKFAAIAEQKKAAVTGMQQNRVRKQPLPAFNAGSPLRIGRRANAFYGNSEP